MALLTLGMMMVLLTGSVPLTSSFSESKSSRTHRTECQTLTDLAASAGVSTELEDPKAPYAVPTLTISFIYHAANAFFCYARYTSDGQASFVFGALGSAGLAAVGLWCILFASSSGRISRKTGADKRTSGFPFGNKESASAKKKQMGKAI
jgi:hypothetical protein